jgi:hypothetical protein
MFRTAGLGVAAVVAGLWTASAATGQVVINEIVKEVRSQTSSGSINPDAREFLELYNPTASPIDISGWAIQFTDLNNVTGNGYFLPANQSIPAGGYYVVAASGGTIVGANHYATPLAATGTELFPDLVGLAISLRSPDLSTVYDAVLLDTYATSTVANKLANQPADEASFTGNGFWAQSFSLNHATLADRYSYARWRDGVTTNSTGRDFGNLAITQGASNNTAASISPALTVPDADAAATNSVLPGFRYSFKGPRAIEPGTASAINPRVVPTSPQGGKAIVAWDETGGGNAIYSNDIVRSFDIDAYLDTTVMGFNNPTEQEWEHSIYGIGTTDGFFGTPNPFGTIDTSGTPVPSAATRTQNGSTGIGWVYERAEGLNGVDPTAKLAIVDFGDSGDSINDWNIIQEFDLDPQDTGWYRLSIDYDPTTGAVEATFGANVVNFNTTTGLYGNFYVGYREGLTTDSDAAPPIFDMRAPLVSDDADFDGDGDVDGADFLTWQRGVGTAGTQAQGNANGVGLIDGADLAIWEAQFGTATVASAPVPEPTSLVLVSLAALGLVAARRRRA